MADQTPAVTATGPAKEKLRTIMDAASALTALGDEESTATAEQQQKNDTDAAQPEGTDKAGFKRYIPEYKKPDAALTFPEKMMNLMKFAQEQDEGFCVAWLADGKSFVIRNPDEFTRQVVPKFFKATKFSSFTRKLYRWGFRQVNRGIGPDDPIIFGNEHFLRDKAEEMSKMRSITAASSRKAEAQTMYGGKRTLDGGEAPDHKRALLDHLLQQKAALMNTNPNMYANMGPPAGTAVSLTSALRPSLGLGVSPHARHQQQHHHHPQVAHHYNGGLPAMMSKHMDIIGQQQHQQNNTNLMNSYMQQNTAANHHHHQAAQSYPSTASTADIVNAAISALRYAS